MPIIPKHNIGRKGNFFFISNVKKIEKSLWDKDRASRLAAVKYLKDELKTLVENKYGKGDLYKGIDYYNSRYISKIGFHKPAYHAHLIELGTDIRFVKNFKGYKGERVEVGYMKKKPFFVPFLNSQIEKVKDVIFKEWIKL